MSNILLTRGIVLWEMPIGETDKLLTVLTPDYGKLTVRARGVRRKNSRLAAAAQLLVYSDMKLFSYKDHYTLDEANSLAQFWTLKSDLALLALGSYFAELTRIFSDTDTVNTRLLSLLLNALYGLDTLRKPPALVKPAFELRLLALSGFAPDLSHCAVCGTATPLLPMFHVTEGLLHCATCPLSAPYGHSVSLCADSLAAMRFILSAESKRFLSFTLEGEARKLLGAAAEAFTLAQTGQMLPTLTYYHTVAEALEVSPSFEESNNIGD